MNQYIFFLSLVFAYTSPVYSQHSFKVIPLGVKGGIDESNLSSYMLAAEGSENYVCLDAGTLHVGIQKAVESGLFTNNALQVLRTNVKGYLISHPHLDHVSGLIINSPDDSVKAIYALTFCIDVLKNNYFTWKSWANFANEGDKPALNKYHYVRLDAEKETVIENTDLFVTAFPLSHSKPGQSTAFLMRHNDSYCLYLGDTGADTLENSSNLRILWQAVAPLVKAAKLKVIFIEVSFPNQQPEKLLFGHLTPKLLMQEMHALSALAGNDAIKDLPIVITHIKPNGNNEEQIKKQVNEMNNLQLKIIFPQQAKLLEF
jgi:cAMP phosphodiesterase